MPSAPPASASEPAPWTPVADGLRVAVRLSPRASRNAVRGLKEAAGGGRALDVAVTAPPEGGKANAALIRLLAEGWRLPKSAIGIAAGASDRDKVLMVHGAPEELARMLGAWLEELDWLEGLDERC